MKLNTLDSMWVCLRWQLGPGWFYSKYFPSVVSCFKWEDVLYTFLLSTLESWTLPFSHLAILTSAAVTKGVRCLVHTDIIFFTYDPVLGWLSHPTSLSRYLRKLQVVVLRGFSFLPLLVQCPIFYIFHGNHLYTETILMVHFMQIGI